MKLRTFIRSEAQADIREAARWYEAREAGLGLRFVGEVRDSLRRIGDSPLRFPIVDRDVRRALLHKFPILHLLRKRTGSRCNHRGASSTPSPSRLEISSIRD